MKIIEQFIKGKENNLVTPKSLYLWQGKTSGCYAKNIPFGYPVLIGQGIEPSMIKIYPVKSGDEILLASDGYTVLRGTLEESAKKLQRILKEDPLCFRAYRSTKGKKSCNVSFDDRAYCRILM